ncbi:MAG: SH3 domain-containing protein [Clostridia bacterium]|nr:SH3 domain-containing protein [Clostridia bacterium]
MKKAALFLTVPVLLALLAAMIPAALAATDVYTKEELDAMTMVVTADYVNMRAGYAGTSGHKQIINYNDGLMKGEEVYCLDRHKGWYCVLRIKGHNSTVGWVWGDFVKFKTTDVSNGGNAKGGDVSNGSKSKYVGGTPASDTNSVKNHYSSQYNQVINTLMDMGKW